MPEDAQIQESGRVRRMWLMLLLGVPVIYLLGALTASLLYAWLEGSGGALEEFVLRKGPHRLVRRCAMLWIIPFLPLFFRELRWRGVRDCGWQPNEGALAPKRMATLMGTGFVIGLVSLGVIGVLMHRLGIRIVVPERQTLMDIGLHALRVTVQCLAVGLVEETLVRGILLRGLTRIIRFWPAALVSSLLFSTLHFMKPAADSMSLEAGILANAFSALSTLHDPFLTEANIPLQWINLTLMGLSLCLVYRRTGTIWLCAGLHAGWVWVKLMNGFLTNVDRGMDYQLLLGTRSDITDSLLCTGILLAIAGWALAGRPAQSEQS